MARDTSLPAFASPHPPGCVLGTFRGNTCTRRTCRGVEANAVRLEERGEVPSGELFATVFARFLFLWDGLVLQERQIPFKTTPG